MPWYFISQIVFQYLIRYHKESRVIFWNLCNILICLFMLPYRRKSDLGQIQIQSESFRFTFVNPLGSNLKLSMRTVEFKL
jgi:hypothetical protein